MAAEGCPSAALCSISRDFSRLSSCRGQVAYVLLTRAPVAGGRGQALVPAAPRLACVKPVASVHPEPGSNSSLLYVLFFFSIESSARLFALSLPVQDAFARSAVSRTVRIIACLFGWNLTRVELGRCCGRRYTLVLLLICCHTVNVRFACPALRLVADSSAKLASFSEPAKKSAIS